MNIGNKNPSLQTAARRLAQSKPLSKASEEACIDVVFALLDDDDDGYPCCPSTLVPSLVQNLAEFASSITKKKKRDAAQLGDQEHDSSSSTKARRAAVAAAALGDALLLPFNNNDAIIQSFFVAKRVTEPWHGVDCTL